MSMRKAGMQIGFSASYIAHIETGRMNTPKNEKLIRLLEIYNVSVYEYEERLNVHMTTPDQRDELKDIVTKLRDSELEALFVVARDIIST